MNSHRNRHTHWLAAQSHPQNKVSQRVCQPSSEKEMQSIHEHD